MASKTAIYRRQAGQCADIARREAGMGNHTAAQAWYLDAANAAEQAGDANDAAEYRRLAKMLASPEE